MADLPTKSFTTLVQDQVGAIQGGATKYLVDTTIGSILRAIVEAVAAVVLWLQGMILRLLATTRAATSTDTDLDTWMADFGITRLPAVAAAGDVTFSRFTSTMQAVVPIGVLVQTGDGTEQFAVVLDSSNAAYSAALGGYVLAPGTASVTVPVSASIAGTGGNVVIGGISSIAQAIAGVDTVTNAIAFDTGSDAEKDPALRARFIVFLASLSKATKAAVGYAVTSLQQGLTYRLVENEAYDGSADPGYFYVVVNDGTGSPSDTTIGDVGNAIEAVRPICSGFGVFAPETVEADVSMTITTASSYTHIAVAALVQAAISAYLTSLGLGETLVWSRLIQVAYAASPGVTGVADVLLNGGTDDLAITARQVALPGTITIA